MRFVSDDRIRFINKEGLDCIITFKPEEAKFTGKKKQKEADPSPYAVSYTKRDNWNPDLTKERHTIFERRWDDDDEDMLHRLI